MTLAFDSIYKTNLDFASVNSLSNVLKKISFMHIETVRYFYC